MMKISENISLKAYNTFGIDVKARYYSSFSSPEELADFLDFTKDAPLILGGGSNILFTRDVDCLALRNEIPGVDLVREDGHHVYVRVGAGENWHGFVRYCLQRNWAGVENLSLIPGSVGAAPMQNIGAYGVELKEVFHELQAWDLREKKVYTFSVNDCEFGYRESVFKRRHKGRFIIINVTFRLNKKPTFHTEYGAIREELDKMGVRQLSIQAISEAVIHIRTSKLPDPAQIGNAGSFFKNPTVSEEHFARLKALHPGIVGYPNVPAVSAVPTAASATAVPVPSPGSPAEMSPPVGDRPGSVVSSVSSPPVSGSSHGIKLAAGWLIEQCGWKGYRKGDAGVHERQALVLVNHGNVTGREIYALSEEILQSVQAKFGVVLEREVNIIS